MGCRLCINIKNEGEVLGNMYFQSAGYFDEMTNVVGRLLGDLNGPYPTISVERLNKYDKKERSSFTAVLIFDLFRGIGGYYKLLGDDEKKRLSKVDCDTVDEVFKMRKYMFANVFDVNGYSCVSNISIPSFHRGSIGLVKPEIEENEECATYTIDVHIDKKILDFSRYFWEVEDLSKKDLVKECIINKNFLEVVFDDFNKIFRKMVPIYCTLDDKGCVCNNNFYNNVTKKIYACE